MSNRKKAKDEQLRLEGSLGKNWGLPDTDKVMVDPFGIAMSINAPSTDKIIAKEVPATVDIPTGVEVEIGSCETLTRENGVQAIIVGSAQIYEDGSVSVIVDDNAPQWAKDKINATAGEFGYTIGTKLNE